MIHKSLIWLLILAMTYCQPWSSAAAGESDVHEWGRHADDKINEGAIVIEAQDGTRKVAQVLGGQLGKEIVNGIDVGLFVLQASSPERLKPGAKGPTHIFNVAFVAEDGGGLLADVTGAVVIAGAESRQRVALQPFRSHYQVATRLEQTGNYDLHVEFDVAGRAGATQPVRFTYKRKTEAGKSQAVK